MATTPSTLKGTPKKKANTSGLTITNPEGKYNPFASSGEFSSLSLPTYTPATTATSGLTPTSGVNSAALSGGAPPGVPQSFVDDQAGAITRDMSRGTQGSSPHDGKISLSYGGRWYDVPVGPDGQPTPEGLTKYLTDTWNDTPPDKKQSYQQRDTENIAGQNQRQLGGIQTQAALGGPAQDAAYASRAWQPVTAAQGAATQAIGAQKTGDLGAEATDAEATRQFGLTLDQEEALRRSGIEATNAGDTADAEAFKQETIAANQRNVGFADQWTQSAKDYNANQTQGFEDYRGDLRAINQNQTQALGQFQGDISSANNRQDANLNQFGGAVSNANANSGNILNAFGGAVDQANAQQMQIVAQYQQEMAGLNQEDRAAFQQYLTETNPLLAALVAQGSNPQYVKNQEDVVQRYRDLSTPQVTDQERFLAELARRKFEGDDQGNRQALMAQLRTRGLNSGGLVIAGQQQAQQQLSQDRQLNELGLNAQAVSRSLQGLAGYKSASDSLRAADDDMRNFQDQYAQNDAIRRGNLAQQRNNQSLATTAAVTGRDSNVYNARTQSNQLNYQRDADYYQASRETNNDIYGRNRDYYDASTETVNDNFARTQAGYDATSQTNRDNAGRDTDIFNGLTKTNEDNSARTTSALANQEWVNQGNLGNTQNAISGPNGTMTVRDANDLRTQGGINTREIAAGSKRQAINQDTAGIRSDRASEAQTAINWVPVAAGTAETGTKIQQGLTQEQQDAIDRLVGRTNKDRGNASAGIT